MLVRSNWIARLSYFCSRPIRICCAAWQSTGRTRRGRRHHLHSDGSGFLYLCKRRWQQPYGRWKIRATDCNKREDTAVTRLAMLAKPARVLVFTVPTRAAEVRSVGLLASKLQDLLRQEMQAVRNRRDCRCQYRGRLRQARRQGSRFMTASFWNKLDGGRPQDPVARTSCGFHRTRQRIPRIHR